MNKSFMRKASALVCLTLSLTGCHVSSKLAMNGPGGRNAYNNEIQLTNNQQMLTNIVRLRYCDIPFFLDVSNITTQFTWKNSVNANVKIPGFDHDNPVSIGGDMTWQNQPTIQYSPLEGPDFASHIMKPIDLKTIQKLIFTGWDVNRVFRLMVQRLDDLPNAPLAAGPAPDAPPEFRKFFEATELLRYFQRRGQLQVGVGHRGPNGTPKNGSCPAPDTLQISFPDCGEKAQQLADLLPDAKMKGNRYFLNLQLGFDEAAQIGIMPRSILGCMYYLSLGVRVPIRDIQNRVVTMTPTNEGIDFDWEQVLGGLMTVHYSFEYPVNAFVAIKYRDHWFYIDDRDICSKRTFVLLQQLYNLQSIEISTVPPLLTIPLGVG